MIRKLIQNKWDEPVKDEFDIIYRADRKNQSEILNFKVQKLHFEIDFIQKK